MNADVTVVTVLLEQVFGKILREQMQDIPILNHKIRVQAVGFRCYEGRLLGVIITPWMMNLMLLPAADDDWQAWQPGHKEVFEFPSKPCQFMLNEFDRVGKCQTRSLYSPMNSFASHEQAVVAAQQYLAQLLTAPEQTEETVADEQLLARILRGENKRETATTRIGQQITRRDLLRGKFNHNTDCAGQA